jgi:hypothetical protein
MIVSEDRKIRMNYELRGPNCDCGIGALCLDWVFKCSIFNAQFSMLNSQCSLVTLLNIEN